jgi:3-deoxy-D-manno-octulosonate 8-phosphate phosphatase (KDO 8-P phosphatase)
MIKLVVFDFDGVFTNGNIFYSSSGEQLKYYNVKDGLAIKLLKNNSIKSAIISSHSSDATKHITHHLNFDKISIGSQSTKHDILCKWIIEFDLKWSEIAYIGDDIVDIDCCKSVGFSACPADAVDDVKKICNYVCNNRGGECAVREFVEYIIHLNNSLTNHY